MRDASSAQPRNYLIVAVVLSAIAFFIAFGFVEPPPPDSLRIAAGAKGGAYYAFAERYREALARDNITLEILETAGSLENLALLQDREEDIDIALLQGGILEESVEGLEALASVFTEPLWVFYRKPEDVDQLPDLLGRNIAAGAEGSGTRHLALRLLADNGINVENSILLALGSSEGAAALIAGDVDAAFFVTNASSKIVQKLLRTPEIALMTFSRAQAYAQRDNAMSAIVLYEGVIDLARDIPHKDRELLAPTATLIARKGLHPALASLLLQTLEDVHGEGGLFEKPGTFPSPERIALPNSPEADRFFRSGRPFLQRVLPFWIANLVDRLLVLAIPLLTLIIPLIRILPPVYRWRVRNRVNRLYASLARLEARYETGEVSRDEAIEEIKNLNEKAGDVAMPKSYVGELYDLRFHLDRVRQRLEEGRALDNPSLTD